MDCTFTNRKRKHSDVNLKQIPSKSRSINIMTSHREEADQSEADQSETEQDEISNKSITQSNAKQLSENEKLTRSISLLNLQATEKSFLFKARVKKLLFFAFSN